ncbi:hypothetical protein AB7M35_002289 [Amorphus suaedae]
MSMPVGLAAGAVVFVGLVGMWEASGYEFGSLRQFGPAVFPFALSALLLLSGLGILLEGSPAGEEPFRLSMPRGVVFLTILAGPIAFALTVGTLGLVPAIFACVLISVLAERSLSLLKALLLGAVLAAGCTMVFVVFLNLPLRPFVW